MNNYTVICYGGWDYGEGNLLRHDCIAETPKIALAVAKVHFLSDPRWFNYFEQFYIFDSPPVAYEEE